MNDFNFGEVLTRAWQIIWKHKVLWIFGILASCGRGGGGGGSGGGNSGFSQPDRPPFSDTRAFDQFGQWVNENMWIFIVIAIVVLILIVLFAFLGTIGRIGLIKGTYKAEQGAEQLILGEMFSESTPYFWRVFGLSFLIGLVFLILLIPIILFGVLTAGIGFACLLPLICILIPISWVVMVVIEQSNAAIVLEDLNMLDGLKRGWEIVKSNIGPAILMAIILGVISFVVGLVIAIPLLIAVIPLVIGAASGEPTSYWIAGICCVIHFPILLALNGIMVAYVASAWTLTYMRLTRKPESDNTPTTPENGTPVLPEDSDKTILASRPNA